MIPLQVQAHLSHGNAPELGAGVIIHRQVRLIMTALKRAHLITPAEQSFWKGTAEKGIKYNVL